MRQESQFLAEAKSQAGAVGLMQLMPATAHTIAMRIGMTPHGKPDLTDPEVSLTLAQEYIGELTGNAGHRQEPAADRRRYKQRPGGRSSAGWRAGTAPGSAALRGEHSSRETRTFTHQVMANFWIYRQRLGQPTPDLDALAAGRWPTIPLSMLRADKVAVLPRIDETRPFLPSTFAVPDRLRHAQRGDDKVGPRCFVELAAGRASRGGAPHRQGRETADRRPAQGLDRRSNRRRRDLTGGTASPAARYAEAFQSVYEKRSPASARSPLAEHTRRSDLDDPDRATGGAPGGTYLFALPGSPGACLDGWRFWNPSSTTAPPCNLVELMRRLQGASDRKARERRLRPARGKPRHRPTSSSIIQ